MNRQGVVRWFLLGLCAALVMPALAEAQPGRGGGGGGRRGGGFGGPGGGGTLGMLMRDDVRAELKITEAQAEELQEVGRGVFESMRESFANFRDMSQEEREAARDKMEKDVRDKAMAVMNSEQAARFGELEFQYLLQQGDLTSALKTAGIDMQGDQEAELRAKQESVTKRIQEEVAKLRQAGNKEILAGVVSDTQLERLMGKPFAFEQAPPQGGGPRFGGPGGQGRGRRDRPAAEEDSNSDSAPAGGRRRRDL